MLLATQLGIPVAGGDFSWPSQQNFTNNPTATIPEAKESYIRDLNDVHDSLSKAGQEAIDAFTSKKTTINTPGPPNTALAWKLMPPPKPRVNVTTLTTHAD